MVLMTPNQSITYQRNQHITIFTCRATRYWWTDKDFNHFGFLLEYLKIVQAMRPYSNEAEQHLVSLFDIRSFKKTSSLTSNSQPRPHLITCLSAPPNPNGSRRIQTSPRQRHERSSAQV
jgi:hypothetical protein